MTLKEGWWRTRNGKEACVLKVVSVQATWFASGYVKMSEKVMGMVDWFIGGSVVQDGAGEHPYDLVEWIRERNEVVA